jgi:NADH pyrophosphatase NudC (nudix superfamily)
MLFNNIKSLLSLLLLILISLLSNVVTKVYYHDKYLKKTLLSSTTFEEILSLSTTVFLPLTRKGDNFVKKISSSSSTTSTSTSTSSLHPIYLDKNKLTDDHYNNSLFIYLGQRSNDEFNRHYVAFSIDDDDDDSNNIYPNELKELNVIKGNLRTYGEDLLEQDAALLAMARGLMVFHNNNNFCSSCGHTTVSYKNGSARKCTNDKCKKSIFPRIEPASIMLILSKDNKHCLLGRKKEWIAGRYSTLAGFLEVGETIENCCIRETFEESGVNVDIESVQIIATQPWPFPSSLMVGIRAIAEDSGLPIINIDKNEMEDIKWFHIDEVKNALKSKGENGNINFPGKSSLGRYLINQWVNENC